MKKMKTKRFLSLLLALVMSMAMAVPAFAADGPDDPDDPDAGIMPLMTLYDSGNMSLGVGSTDTSKFTSTPGNGKYIKVWYANRTNYYTTVSLYRTDDPDPVRSKTFAPNSYAGNEIWYDFPDKEPVTFFVRIEVRNSYPIVGQVAVAQLSSKS